MCDAMDPDKVEAPVIGQILSAIIDGMRSDRPNEVSIRFRIEVGVGVGILKMLKMIKIFSCENLCLISIYY
jgi:hypothetical protein